MSPRAELAVAGVLLAWAAAIAGAVWALGRRDRRLEPVRAER